METLISLSRLSSVPKSKINNDKLKFDALPEYSKISLYHSNMFNYIQKQPLKIKKISYENLKLTALKKLNNKKYNEAHVLFSKYITSKNPKWNIQGIKDNELIYHYDYGNNTEEQKEINKMIISSLLNISLCDLKLNQFEDVRKGCNEVIKLDKNNIKAQRAFSYFQSKSSSAKDLEFILSIEENKEIRNEYNQIKEYIEEQKKSGTNNLSLVLNEKQNKNQRDIKDDNSSTYSFENEDSNEPIEVTNNNIKLNGKTEMKILKFIIGQCYNLMIEYCETNNAEDYFTTKAIHEKAQFYAENLSKLQKLDFDNPDNSLKELSIKLDINLEDEQARLEMINFKNKYIKKIKKFYEETITFTSDSEVEDVEVSNANNKNTDTNKNKNCESNNKKKKKENTKSKDKELKSTNKADKINETKNKQTKDNNYKDNKYINKKDNIDYKQNNIIEDSNSIQTDDYPYTIKIKKYIHKRTHASSNTNLDYGKKMNKQKIFYQLFYIISSLVLLCITLLFLCLYYEVN